MRPRLRLRMASPVEACSSKKVQHIIQNVAILDMFSRRRSMRHLLALELASVLDGTRIHSFGRAIVMSREWENEWWEWCMRVLEASDLQPVRHNCTECFILTVQNVTVRTEFVAIPAFLFFQVFEKKFFFFIKS